MWSFGCIVAELFIGLPLFPGASEYDVLQRMMTILGQVSLPIVFSPNSAFSRSMDVFLSLSPV